MSRQLHKLSALQSEASRPDRTSDATTRRGSSGGQADLIAFGRKFLANPDLPERLRKHASLNPDDPATYYGGGANGYTDYPTLAQQSGDEPKPCVDNRWR